MYPYLLDDTVYVISAIYASRISSLYVEMLQDTTISKLVIHCIVGAVIQSDRTWQMDKDTLVWQESWQRIYAYRINGSPYFDNVCVYGKNLIWCACNEFRIVLFSKNICDRLSSAGSDQKDQVVCKKHLEKIPD